jgi:iron complex transport system ATP-binding protein
VTLTDVLEAVSARVPYLRGLPATDGDHWQACDELAADRATLERVVAGTKVGFGTDDDAVAASLFVQSYAFRVGGAALGAYALGLPVPRVEPALTAVRIDKPRPTAVAYLDPQVGDTEAAPLAHALVDGHFAPFVAAVHATYTVGERLLWGNVASSCAAVFRALESSGADVPAVRQRAEAFMAAAPAFAGLGGFTIVRTGDHEGWFWDRTSCCLWFRTTGGQLCDNCSLVDPAELQRRRERELATAS